VNRLVAQQKKLSAEEDDAEVQLEKLQSQLSEAVSRLQRIRKIRKKVKERSDELFRRGMEELDKEDGITSAPDVLPALEGHEYWVVDDLQHLGVPNDPDWSSFGLGDFSDVGPLVGETSSGGAGPSSGV
jgi:predicted transcriptional regulator